jgi:hypothetical protein
MFPRLFSLALGGTDADMLFSRNKCDTCGGDGKCPECFGSGVNIHLDEDEPKCRKCAGTGKCPVCEGTGKLPRS